VTDWESTITLQGYALPSIEGFATGSVKGGRPEADPFRVTAATPSASTQVDSDGLIEWRRSAESRSLAPRITTGLIAGAFLVVALGALALPAHRPFSVLALATTLVCYLLCSRVHFEFGSGWAIPTQTVFVVMWFVLPPRLLPLIVCTALVEIGRAHV